MTIASHCLALLHEQGPLSAEDLGSACRDAGVTTSKQPAQAVASALTWNMDGRALLVQGRFHAVSALLEGRWLTFSRPESPPDLQPDVDLACLTRLVEREGLPLASGGTVTARRYSYNVWTGPDDWLPEGATLGLRLIGGIAHVSVVVLDQAAEDRGEQLAALFEERDRRRGYGLASLDYFGRRKTASQGLLSLLATNDDLLREPVPPLSSLLPALPAEPSRNSWRTPPPYWTTVHIHISPELFELFDGVAHAMQQSVEEWLTDQLSWVADSPLLHFARMSPGLPLDVSSSVLPFIRSRGLGAS